MSAPGVGTPSHEVFRCFDLTGRVMSLYVHPKEWCIDENDSFCCIHNPSPHRMSQAKQVWDAYKGKMLRECSHGHWHTDPDDIRSPKDRCVEFECDGCCRDYLEGECWEVRELDGAQDSGQV